MIHLSQIRVFTLSLWLFSNYFLIQSLLAQDNLPGKEIAVLADSADSAIVLERGTKGALILLADDATKKLRLFRFSNDQVENIAEEESVGHVWGAAMIGKGESARIILAHGLGRGDLKPPLRILSYPLTLKSPALIHQFDTERAQVTAFKEISGRIALTYFNSKYETEVGELRPVTNGNWSYHNDLTIRMGTSSDSDGKITVIGRMYGDVQGQDGDLVLKKIATEPLMLPSYRGVSSVTLLPATGNAAPQIAIGDGWHSNYGQLAQARLSILTENADTERYSLDLLHIFEDSYAVNRIIPISPKQNAPLLIMTNNKLFLGIPGKVWQFKLLYQQKNMTTVFNVDLAASEGNHLMVLVSDKSASILEFDLSKLSSVTHKKTAS